MVQILSLFNDTTTCNYASTVTKLPLLSIGDFNLYMQKHTTGIIVYHTDYSLLLYAVKCKFSFMSITVVQLYK